MKTKKEKILVIKLSALGDFVQSLGPMNAIRDHHGDTHVTLLTTKPYVTLAEASGYFDEIIIDERPKLLQPKKWLHLQKTLNAEHFTRVYDLQNNDRTAIYFKLFQKPRPEWVGTARNASHRNTDPTRKLGLAFEGHKQTLKLAGIENIKIDNMDWIETDISNLILKKPYALIVSGCAPSRPAKRWSAKNYIGLCQHLLGNKILPVLIGTEDEKDITDKIYTECSDVINLTGKTSLLDIVPLAREAALAIGNDTGPMHMIAPTGCPSLVLFSGSSDPKRHAPLGEKVITLQEDNIDDITLEQVIQSLPL